MAPTIFDPIKFFLRTKHYASQGRGLFRVTRRPLMFQTGIVPQEIASTFDILSTGIAASTISLPARQLGTHTPSSFNGPTRKHAYVQVFADFDVEFMLSGRTVDEARDLYYGLTYWQQRIAGPSNLNRFGIPQRTETPVSDSDMFGAAYYNDYVSDATVTVYSPMLSPTGEPVPIMLVDFTDIYPLTIGGTQLSWATADIPVSLPVTFTYFYSQSRSPR